LNDRPFWLGFSLISGIGSKRLLHLRHWFGDLERAWYADRPALEDAGLTPSALNHFLTERESIDLKAEMAKIQQYGAELLLLADADYPALLRDTDDPPAVLYVRGRITHHDERALAIVGTRKATKYGRDATADLAYQLGANGVTIISGLAQGIDTAAHQGAIDGGGRTIAVLGNGIDINYPQENAALAQRIVANGAIISEFPIGTEPMGKNFPRRNRIISGLALGVMVAEAPERSGALITASTAAEQGREVFAVPGNIYNRMATGTNRLIQDGAKLVQTVADVLDELNIAHDNVRVRTTTQSVAPSNTVEQTLLSFLATDPIHIDELVRLSGLPTAEVSSTLTILELKGLAQMVGHMQYSRTT